MSCECSHLVAIECVKPCAGVTIRQSHLQGSECRNWVASLLNKWMSKAVNAKTLGGVTGHSLGAGVAALMTLRLKDRYPSAKCWAFCPPGGLMSANLSHAAQGFVNCVVVGKDIVPRLSVVNIGRLIDELVGHFIQEHLC